jgi:hypothetical protein
MEATILFHRHSSDRMCRFLLRLRDYRNGRHRLRLAMVVLRTFTHLDSRHRRAFSSSRCLLDLEGHLRDIYRLLGSLNRLKAHLDMPVEGDRTGSRGSSWMWKMSQIVWQIHGREKCRPPLRADCGQNVTDGPGLAGIKI